MKKTQSERIIEYLKEFGSITWIEAFRDLGIARLGARIFDLKRDGYKIIAEIEASKNRFGEPIHYARYKLAEEGEKCLD